MAIASIRNNYIQVETRYREKDLIKQVPGSRYKSDIGAWLVPLSYNAAIQLLNTFKDSISLSEDLKDYIKLIEQYSNELKELKSAEFKSRRMGFDGKELLPLQAAGVAIIECSHPGLILADDMGSGKTVQICAYLELCDFDGISLVVCPKSVKRSWHDHIKDWTGYNPIIVEGTITKRRKLINEAGSGDVLIMNWEQLASHSRLANYGNIKLSEKDKTDKELNNIDFDVIIADEAHRAKSPKSKQTRALWRLSAEYRFALTGTPIANDIDDLWSLLRFVDPQAWPSRVQFIDRYCDLNYNIWGGVDIIGLKSSTEEEFHHLLEPYFLRRTKQEIMGKEINVTKETRYVQLPPKHRKMYEGMRKDLLAQLDDGAFIGATNPLVATSRLTQICAAPLETSSDGEGYQMVGPSPKVAELMDLLGDLGNEQVIVFSSSKQLLSLAADALDKYNKGDGKQGRQITYSLVTGDVTGQDRDYEIRDFQSGRSRVLLGTTGALSEGVNLTNAQYMVFLQRSWSMVENNQAEDRNNRIGQESDNITIIDIVSEDTIDERIHEVFVTKKRKLEEITRDNIKEII